MTDETYRINYLEDKNEKLMEHVLELTKIIEDAESNFETWWYNEGSGITPTNGDDLEEHTYRVSKIAWSNGEYSERHKNKRDTIRNTNTKDKT